MPADDVEEAEEKPVSNVMEEDKSRAMSAFTAMVKAASPAPSAGERAAMNTLAATLADDSLREAAREYIEVSKVRWTSMLRVPDRGKETKQAHTVLCRKNDAAWASCEILLKTLGLNQLPDRRGFLAYLARESPKE